MTPREQNDIDQNTLKVLGDAISLAIKENVGNKRFIDLERIPLICLSITNIGKDISEIKDMISSNRKESDAQHESFVTKVEFAPYKNALNKIAGTIIVALVMAILGLVLILNK